MDGEKLEIEKRFDERYARHEKWGEKFILFVFVLTIALTGAAALWSAFATEPFPMVGLRRQVAQPFVAWVVFLLSVWSGWLYVTRPARNPDLLIFAGGVMFTVGVTILFYIGGAGASVFWLGLFLYKAGVWERERRAGASEPGSSQ